MDREPEIVPNNRNTLTELMMAQFFSYYQEQDMLNEINPSRWSLQVDDEIENRLGLWNLNKTFDLNYSQFN